MGTKYSARWLGFCASVRTEDIVARYGRVKIAFLLPEIDTDQAVAAAERIRKSIAESEPTLDSAVASVRASIGVSGLRPEDTALTLLARADRAMYEAKRRGGNPDASIPRTRRQSRVVPHHPQFLVLPGPAAYVESSVPSRYAQLRLPCFASIRTTNVIAPFLSLTRQQGTWPV